jgi:hypothetical protein
MPSVQVESFLTGKEIKNVSSTMKSIGGKDLSVVVILLDRYKISEELVTIHGLSVLQPVASEFPHQKLLFLATAFTVSSLQFMVLFMMGRAMVNDPRKVTRLSAIVFGIAIATDIYYIGEFFGVGSRMGKEFDLLVKLIFWYYIFSFFIFVVKFSLDLKRRDEFLVTSAD